ncbi:MAG: NUDIX hydrolase [Lachnospiraceae bacterium]|nr:NUDIX hydrolase [Lachnospiraceae bacterium]
MKLESIQKVHDGKYLKKYELTYLNKAGREKKYEIVSRKEIEHPDDLGQRVSGISIIAYKEDKMLLLREFRMAINREIYNLCAGMLEDGESIEECVRRELYEETGLSVKRIIDILPPAFSAVGFSDVQTHIVFVEAEGNIGDHTSDNEEIKAAFYTKEQIETLLKTEEFSARSQLAAYFFTKKH